jgi:prephenate dehydrogenase
MSILDGNFDMADAFQLGAVVGFVEESIKKEEEGETDLLDEVDLSEIDTKYTYPDLKRLSKTNPQLFKAILMKSIELQIKYERSLAEERAKADLENDHELIALAKTEKLLEE